MLKLSFTLPIKFRIEWGKYVPGKLVPLPVRNGSHHKGRRRGNAERERAGARARDGAAESRIPKATTALRIGAGRFGPGGAGASHLQDTLSVKRVRPVPTGPRPSQAGPGQAGSVTVHWHGRWKEQGPAPGQGGPGRAGPGRTPHRPRSGPNQPQAIVDERAGPGYRAMALRKAM